MSSRDVFKCFFRPWTICFLVSCLFPLVSFSCDVPPPNKITQPYGCLANTTAETGVHLQPPSSEGENSNSIITLLERGQNYMDHFKINSIPGETTMNYFLFTRSTAKAAQLLFPNAQEMLQGSSFNPNLSTKVIIHGFYDNPYISNWMQKMKNAFLAESDYNVILVDWSIHNDFPFSTAVSNLPSVAQGVANLILFLVRTTSSTPQSFHIIAHSLGCQVAALSGRIVRNIGRITALDPLGPSTAGETGALFNLGYQHLDPSDALFVDVIHTNTGTDDVNIVVPVGHVDFYPNGGASQPGCENANSVATDPLGLAPAARHFLTCDHFRACEYFTDSIYPTGKCVPIGVSCPNWESYQGGMCPECSTPGSCVPMGFTSEKFIAANNTHQHSQHKKYYLFTPPEVPPFCAFQYQVIVDVMCSSDECPDFLNMRSGYNLGIIYLLLHHMKDKTQTIVLNATVPMMIPGGRYVYMVPSYHPIETVESVKVKWSGPKRPSLRLSHTVHNSGIGFSKIHIYPVTLIGTLTSRLKPIVLCAPKDQIVQPDKHHMEISPKYC